MKKYLLAATLALAVGGCTSPTPENLGYSPAPPTASPAPAAQVDIAPVQPPALDSSVADSSAGFPSPPPCTSGEPGCGTPMKAHACRTVGAVTTCDAPRNPEADRTLYTN